MPYTDKMEWKSFLKKVFIFSKILFVWEISTQYIHTISSHFKTTKCPLPTHNIHVNSNYFQNICSCLTNCVQMSDLMLLLYYKFKDWIMHYFRILLDKIVWTKSREVLPLNVNGVRDGVSNTREEKLHQPLKMTEKHGRHDWEKTYYYDKTSIGEKSIWSQGSFVYEVDELVTNNMENLRYNDDWTYLSPTNTPPQSPGGIY